METWTWNPDYFIDLTDLNGMQSTRSDWKQTPCYSGLDHHWFNLSYSNWITFAWRTRDPQEPSLARPGAIEDTINVITHKYLILEAMTFAKTITARCKRSGLRLKVHNSRYLYYKLITDSAIRMKGLVPICLLSIALISCGQTDNRTDCARLLTIRKNSNSDQKITASELRMELSKRIKLSPKQVDLFCIHYLGKTPVVRSLPPKKTSKSLQT